MSLYVPYKIYIFVNGVHYSYRILFIAVSIKNIVDMSGNNSFSKNTTVEQLNPSVALTPPPGVRPFAMHLG